MADLAQIPADADGSIEVGIDDGAPVAAVCCQLLFGLALRALRWTPAVHVVQLLKVLMSAIIVNRSFLDFRPV